MTAVILQIPTRKAIEEMSVAELKTALRAAQRRLEANPVERNVEAVRAILDEQATRAH